jgi:hypothetical protein
MNPNRRQAAAEPWHGAPTGRDVLQRNSATQAVDNALHDGQAKTCPLSLRARAAEERLEDLIHVGRCDAGAGILNLQDRRALFSINSDIDRSAPGCEAKRVLEQIAADRREHRRLAAHRERFDKREAEIDAAVKRLR